LSSSSTIEISVTLWSKGDRSKGNRLSDIPIKVIYGDPTLKVTLGCQLHYPYSGRFGLGFREHWQETHCLGKE
jgi:hypothetical protein